MAQRLVRLDGVHALLVLQPIGVELVGEPDASPFVITDVHDHARTLLRDEPAGRLELSTAVAPHGSEHVAGQALRVRSYQHRAVWVDLTQDYRHVLLVAGDVFIYVNLPETIVDRDLRHAPLHDQLLVASPVHDQVFDGDDLDPMLSREALQVRHARHGPVVVHHLTDHPGRVQPGKAGQIDRCFGLAGALQDAAVGSTQRKSVTWLGEVLRPGIRVEEVTDRGRTVVCGDAGCDEVPGFYGDAERGAVPARIQVDHRLDLELVPPAGAPRGTHQPSAVPGHEGDVLRRDELSSDTEVAFVLAVLVVDDDDGLAILEVGDCLGYRRERHQRYSARDWKPIRRAT